MNFIEEQKRNFSDLILTGLERIHFDNLNRELRNLFQCFSVALMCNFNIT